MLFLIIINLFIGVVQSETTIQNDDFEAYNRV